MRTDISGFLCVLLAYILWGLAPIYFSAIDLLSSGEILSHRIIWSVIFLAPLCFYFSGFRRLISFMKHRRTRKLIVVAAFIISFNWLTYIYAVNNGYVLDASFGYFLNPIVTVFLGTYLFKETQGLRQRVCLVFAAGALLYQVVVSGSISWVSLSLAGSFAIYGVIKKKLPIPAWDGLFLETLAVLPFAAGYLIYLEGRSQLAFVNYGTGFIFLTILSGIITAVPLVLFSFGAQRVKLSTTGFLQYTAPSLQFILAIYYFNETLLPYRLHAFLILWLGLIILVFPNIFGLRRAKSSLE